MVSPGFSKYLKCGVALASRRAWLSEKRLSYNKHNLRKAGNNAAFTGYAYFIMMRKKNVRVR